MLNLFEVEQVLSETAPVSRSSGCMFCEVERPLILQETENFYLIRDKFPIAPDHLMVISKEHYGCLGEIPLRHFAEVRELREKAAEFFTGRPFIGYEHGRAGHCVKLKGSQITCHHFHMHYVPLKADITKVLGKHFTAKPVSRIEDVRSFYERFGEYLYFENSARAGFFYPANVSVAPHLLRTLVCDAVGLSQRSDWEQL